MAKFGASFQIEHRAPPGGIAQVYSNDGAAVCGSYTPSKRSHRSRLERLEGPLAVHPDLERGHVVPLPIHPDLEKDHIGGCHDEMNKGVPLPRGSSQEGDVLYTARLHGEVAVDTLDIDVTCGGQLRGGLPPQNAASKASSNLKMMRTPPKPPIQAFTHETQECQRHFDEYISSAWNSAVDRTEGYGVWTN